MINLVAWFIGFWILGLAVKAAINWWDEMECARYREWWASPQHERQWQEHLKKPISDSTSAEISTMSEPPGSFLGWFIGWERRRWRKNY